MGFATRYAAPGAFNNYEAGQRRASLTGSGVIGRTGSPSFESSTNDDTQDFPDYEESVTGSEASAGYQKGMRVRHPTFGSGSIYAVEGNGDDTKVSVLFADQTLKKFVVKYARLERI
jgi:DNA helicase-2/ATP-dependent DNA helicase PcrA